MMKILSDDNETSVVWQKTFLSIVQGYIADFNSVSGNNAEILEAVVEKMIIAEKYLSESLSQETMLEILKVKV